MNFIHKYFHWYYFHKGNHGIFNIGLGAFFWLFLAITQPFGIYANNLSAFLLFLYLFPIGLFWVIVVYVVDVAAIRWFNYPIDKNFKLDFWFWFIKLAIVLHIIFFIRGYLCNWSCVNVFEYFQQWFAFLLIFTFFYLPYAFYAKYQFYHNMLVQGEQNTSNLTLLGSSKEVIHLDPTTLIYLQADDNYVDLIIKEQDQQAKKVSIRGTLKSSENQLKQFSQFIRIHRSFIINSNYVSSFAKSKNSITLIFDNELKEFPVSKKYKPLVSEIFTHPK